MVPDESGGGVALLDLGRERRHRYTAGFSLGYFVLVTLAAPLAHGLVRPEVPYLRDIVPMAAHGLAFASLGSYFLARKGELARAGGLLVVSAFVAIWIAVLGTFDTPYEAWIGFYLCLPPLLAGFLWSPRAVILTGAANVAGGIAIAVVGWLPPTFAIGAVILTSAVALMATIVAGVRRYDEGVIEEQAGALVARNDELERIIESNTEGMLVTDGDDRVRLINPVMAQWLPADAIGRPLMDIAPPETRAQLAAMLEQAGDATTEFRLADGRTVEARFHHLEHPAGRLLVFTDITRRLKEEEIRRREYERGLEVDKLRELSTFKSRLLNAASHELNTPLTPIRLQLELLKTPTRGPLTPDQTRSLDIIDRSARRLGNLVQDILDVDRLENGRMQLHLTLVALEALVQDQLRLVAGLAEQGNVKVELQTEASVWVQGDVRRLAQVVHHFLTNAIRFSGPDGHVQVQVTEKDGQARVSFRDDGIGIQPEVRDQLFLPFTKLHTEGYEGGTGLGLYLSKGIIEAHGGRVGYLPLPEGSLFWFDLQAMPSAES